MADNNVTISLDVIGNAAKKIDDIAASIGGLSADISSKMGFAGKAIDLAFSALRVGGPIAASLIAMKKTMDVVFEAENIKAINNQFLIFTKNAGVAAEVLREGLINASGGLADDTDLLKSANKALVELGLNAQKLPEVLALARQITSSLGGDLLENFEAISHAIAGGNQRALKNLGLFVDLGAAYDAYAKTLGTTADKLSATAKQTAALNAVLEGSSQRFAGINTEANAAQNAYQRLKVSLEQLGETAILAFEKIAGPAVSAALNATNSVVQSLGDTIKARLGDQAIIARDQLAELTSGLNILYQAQARGGTQASLSGPFTALSEEIVKTREQIDLLQESQRKLGTSSREAADAAKKEQEALTKQAEASEKLRIATDKRLEAEKKAREERANEGKQIAKSAVEKEETPEAKAEREIVAVKFASEQKVITAQQEADAIAAINIKRDEDIVTRLQEQNARLADEQTIAGQAQIEANNQRIDAILAKEKLSAETIEKIKKKQDDAEKLANKQRLQATADIFGNIKTLAEAAGKDGFEIAKAAGIAQAIVNGFIAYSQALAAAPPPFNFVLAGTVAAVSALNVAKIASSSPPSFAGGIDEVPPGFANDRFPAFLQSGERVVPRSTNQDLKSFLSDSGGVKDAIEGLRAEISNLKQTFIVQIGERVIANEVRTAIEGGRVVIA